MSEKIEIQKTYNPSEVEDEIYKKWEKSGFFNPDNLDLPEDAPTYTIVLPPPNITDKLHLGHAAMLAIEDLLIRYHRMKGYKALWIPGTDHAAIATQNVVEKKLLKEEGLTRHDLGREKFLERVWEFLRETQKTILRQTRKMGASLDWSREAFTLDESRVLAVKKMFIDMYNAGVIYRGERIVNWCPRCHSTLADDEVEYKAQKAKLYTFKYSKDFPFSISTTRPETKLGDTAVAVNPKDKRYAEHIGKIYEVDFCGVKLKLKIIADRHVEMDFGTGALGVTPAHSMADWQMAQENNLEIIKVIGEDGKIKDSFAEYSGKGVEEAREMVVEKLRENNLIESEEEIENNLSVCYRCNAPVEPLPSKQWFVSVDKKIEKLGNKSLKEKAIEVAKMKEIKFIPDRFESRYLHWMENLHDWCISRQIWFGHRIPVYYCGGLEKNIKKMGFAGDIVGQIFDNKTKTYRLRDHGFAVGEKVAFEDSSNKKIFGYGVIKEVQTTTVGEIDLKDEKHWKTYDKREDLIAAFKRHHLCKEINNQTKVWVYTYEFDKDLPKNGCGALIVSDEEPTICPSCGSKKLVQDSDSLDTWFSSGMWTFSTLGWPDTFKDGKKTGDLAKFHPMQVLETGYEILTLWVSRMIMMSLFAIGEIPFSNVYLHGMILDKHGKKMSKSKGNGIDPIDMIEKFGTDAVRLSLLMGSTPGNDARLSEEKIEGFRNFTNKLWNIARYVSSKSKVKSQKSKVNEEKLTLADKWILGRLDFVIGEVNKNLDNYQFSQAGEILKDFTWNDFADWHIEISKFESEEGKGAVLNFVLQNLLKLWHPFMPFVTESIWEMMGNEKMLMVEKWPGQKNQKTPHGAMSFDAESSGVEPHSNMEFSRYQLESATARKYSPNVSANTLYQNTNKKQSQENLRTASFENSMNVVSSQADTYNQHSRYKNFVKLEQKNKQEKQDFELVKNIIIAIRTARSENKIEPSKKIKAVICAGERKDLVESQAHLIKNLKTGIEELEVVKSLQPPFAKEGKIKPSPDPSAGGGTNKNLPSHSFAGGEKIKNAIYTTVGGIDIYLIGAIDFEKERARIKGEIEEVKKYIKQIEEKLSKREFVNNAPEAVVQKERDKLAAQKERLKKLEGSL